jgi:hypothetical protein
MFLCEFIFVLTVCFKPTDVVFSCTLLLHSCRLYQFHVEHCVIYCPTFDFNVEPLFVLIILMILYQTKTYCWRICNEHHRGPWCLHFQDEVEGNYVEYIQTLCGYSSTSQTYIVWSLPDAFLTFPFYCYSKGECCLIATWILLDLCNCWGLR